MTDRAKRAAAELEKRGWQIDYEVKSDVCSRCLRTLAENACFCHHCGTLVGHNVELITIDDLESAIAAANGETP